ncbi:MAG: choice-of-anchor P family protein [Nitrosotalea sp.]
MTINNKYTRFGFSVAAVFTAMIMVTGVIAPAINPAFAESTVGGRATALSVSSPLGPINFMDTGPLQTAGSELDATPITINTPLATADGLLSVTMGSSQAESQSATGQLVLLPGSSSQITAYSIYSQSAATCAGASGYSDITNLTIGGQTISITGQPNQVVNIPGGSTLTINEQIVSPNGITVNALHLHTALGTDVIVSSASSSISCTSTLTSLGGLLTLGLLQPAYGWETNCVDFTTGGGWVQPPPNKGTFGFVAGYKNGGTDPRGNFEYQDHTSGMNVHALDVAYYKCGDFDNSRIFGGDARVNGDSGYCYKVYVQDNGEPGKNTDYFAMWEWAAPASGCPTDGSGPPSGVSYYSTGNYLGGGNIQLHR